MVLKLKTPSGGLSRLVDDGSPPTMNADSVTTISPPCFRQPDYEMNELAAWCIYCGGELIGVRRGEHVLPDAIGCQPAIRCVCNGCNHGILSELDTVLVYRSHLSVVRFKRERKKLRLAWDIDHADGNLLLDAEPTDGTFSSFTIWPQMIVETDSVQFRADESDLKNQDGRTCARIFSHHLRNALQTLEGGGRKKKKVYFQ